MQQQQEEGPVDTTSAAAAVEGTLQISTGSDIPAAVACSSALGPTEQDVIRQLLAPVDDDTVSPGAGAPCADGAVSSSRLSSARACHLQLLALPVFVLVPLLVPSV
jgi:hypothetical protein